MYVLSIDVGLINMGLVGVYVGEDYKIDRWKFATKVNIQRLCVNCRCRSTCGLRHERTFCDYIDHLVQVYQSDFEECDYIIIERQPPVGFVVIQELILNKFRNKTVIVSPNSVHKFHNISQFDYEGRKTESLRIALDTMGGVFDTFQIANCERQHDVADAVCQLLFWLDKTRTASKPAATPFNKFALFIPPSSKRVIHDFSMFEYRGAL